MFAVFSSYFTKMVTDSKKYKGDGNIPPTQCLPSTNTKTITNNSSISSNSFTLFSSRLTKMLTDSKKYKDDGNVDMAITTLESAIKIFNAFITKWTPLSDSTLSHTRDKVNEAIKEWKSHESLLVDWKSATSRGANEPTYPSLQRIQSKTKEQSHNFI